jgi:hypothetical protein
MKLVPGKTYSVTDYYGMVTFEARLVGRARTNFHNRELFVLEREGESGFRFAGCEVRTHINKDHEVVPYLFASHYGETVEGLRPQGTPRNLSWRMAPWD